MSGSVGEVVAHVERNIPDLSTLRLDPLDDYASLPLCVIDSVYSIGVKYAGTENTVRRWCDHTGWPRKRRDGGPEHTISEFLEIIEPYSHEQLATEVFQNRQRTSSRSGALKSDAVRQFAKVLRAENVETFCDIRSNAAVERVEPRIKNEVVGQKSGISFDYFMILAGSDEFIKADRMICRFVADALGVLERDVKPEDAKKLFLTAANELRRHYPNITARALDNAVWKFQRAKGPREKVIRTCREPA